MPWFVKLIIRNGLAGLGVSVVFVTLFLWTDITGLGTLIAGSPDGWLAAFLLYFFTFLTFGSVQIGIAIMHIGQDRPQSGLRDGPPPLAAPVPARARRG